MREAEFDRDEASSEEAAPRGAPPGSTSRADDSIDDDPIEFPVEVRPTAGAMFAETGVGAVGIVFVLFGLMWMTGVGNHTYRLIAAAVVGSFYLFYYALRFFAKAPSFVRIDDAELIVEGKSGIEHLRWDAMTRAVHCSMMGLRWEFYDATLGEIETGSDEEDPFEDHEPCTILRDDGFSSARWTLVSRAISTQLERHAIPITSDDDAESFEE